jgi:hypothetical protein
MEVVLKRHAAFLCFFFLFFMSCNQNLDTPVDSTPDTGLLLSKVFADGMLVNEYLYDSNNNLIELKTFHEDSLIQTESYGYNDDNRLLNRYHDGFVDTYSYNKEGLLIGLSSYYAATDKTWEETYTYDSQKKIEVGKKYFNGEKIANISYKYDKNGNTVKHKEYYTSGDFLVSEYRFSFDSKISPFALNFPLDMVQSNNIIEYYYYQAIMSYMPPQYESTFEYNSEDLPIKETRMYQNRDDPIIYEYVYVSKK